ncbi:RHS repeat-associated core domain-containing protein [Motilimonas sp. E26]|uniref:RHS repeat domain-containing protein n=1 Tax=Motilimonas sp. E26 TaxID=2865674 RepID=UPI001E436F15|nr:RHS repeat-associated core domain-containing protein [Motilimonas sp. E26]MCE0556149.1 RHS repeat-associated core domain-containing protein [Motilimonas sp. E26]
MGQALGGAGDLVEEKYFIGDMVLTQRSNNTKDSFYTIKDHQGSVLMTLNGSGQEVNRYYYRPFGEQLDVSLNPLGLQTLRPTQYGYTGHEHVKDLDIINMGGRIYAAGLRRFLQADPVVDHPMYSQSYNPYQYVYGNPLVNVDPSGYSVVVGQSLFQGMFAYQNGDPSGQAKRNAHMTGELQAAINAYQKSDTHLAVMLSGANPLTAAFIAIADSLGIISLPGAPLDGEQQESKFTTPISDALGITATETPIADQQGPNDTAHDAEVVEMPSALVNDGGGVEVGLNVVLSTSERSKGEKVRDFINHPENWEMVRSKSWTSVNGRTGKKKYNTESEFYNKETRETMWNHTAYDDDGNEVHNNPGSANEHQPDGGSVRDHTKVSEWKNGENNE